MAIKPHEVPVTQLSGIPHYFTTILEYTDDVYNKLHTCANNLVVANAKCYAGHLYELCECLLEYIKEYKRVIQEGNISNWSDAFIQRLMEHETTLYNVHDHFEEKEKSIGYDF